MARAAFMDDPATAKFVEGQVKRATYEQGVTQNKAIRATIKSIEERIAAGASEAKEAGNPAARVMIVTIGKDIKALLKELTA